MRRVIAARVGEEGEGAGFQHCGNVPSNFSGKTVVINEVLEASSECLLLKIADDDNNNK